MNTSGKQWVILVDDDEDDRFLIQQAFKQQNTKYILQALQNGEELFQILEQSIVLPALILLDLNMPLMNGFEVLKYLRTHPTYCAIPTIILTTSDAETDRQRARELGANSFVTKPPTLEELIKVIAQLKQDWLVVR